MISLLIGRAVAARVTALRAFGTAAYSDDGCCRKQSSRKGQPVTGGAQMRTCKPRANYFKPKEVHSRLPKSCHRRFDLQPSLNYLKVKRSTPPTGIEAGMIAS
jgi:hypothetical protein